MRTALLISCCLVMSCANEIDETPNNLLPPERASGPCADMLKVGDWYRFETLRLTSLGGDVNTAGNGSEGLLNTLSNTLWAADIEKQELNILIEVLAVTAADVTFRISNGASAGDAFCVLPEPKAEMTQPITDEGLGTSTSASLAVYAGGAESPKNCNPKNPPHAIPVVDVVVVKAGCDADQQKISGNLTGLIERRALEFGCACLALDPKATADEFCGKLQPINTDEVDPANPCKSCVSVKPDGSNGGFVNLLKSLPSFNGENGDLEFRETSTDGHPASPIAANFDAVLYGTTPEACP